MKSQEYKNLDVVQLLQSLYIEGQRTPNGEWWAKCPTGNHKDKTPSWSIKDKPGFDKHGFHMCFACGFSGGPISLVREVIGFSHDQAELFLQNIETSSIPVSKVEWIVDSPTRSRFTLPKGVVVAPLQEWINPPRQFLQKRCIASQADSFGLGYAVTGRLAGRVVIPVYNAKNELVSYTGRTYVDDPKRYKEPSAEENADKNAIFGEHLWMDPHRLRGIVAIVEGALNAMAIKEVFPSLCVAAIMGSSVSPVHVLKFTATFGSALVMTDSDFAGQVAFEKLEGALCRHMKLVRVETGSENDWNDWLIHDKHSLWKTVQQGLDQILNS